MSSPEPAPAPTPRGPAYRIETRRLCIRCWHPADAPALSRAIEANAEHLRPWMPWIQREPLTLDQRIELLRSMRGKFDLGVDFAYGILDRDEASVLGGTGLHPRVGPRGIEIGYWIHAAHVGQGLATEAAAALVRVAFEVLALDRVEIHCGPENARSAAVPRRLGFTLEATLRRRGEDGAGAPRDTMMWSLFASDYPSSPARAFEARAFDAAGRPLL
jgi:RimJ/RimL family protein N-acetyltransferase